MCTTDVARSSQAQELVEQARLADAVLADEAQRRRATIAAARAARASRDPPSRPVKGRGRVDGGRRGPPRPGALGSAVALGRRGHARAAVAAELLPRAGSIAPHAAHLTPASIERGSEAARSRSAQGAVEQRRRTRRRWKRSAGSFASAFSTRRPGASGMSRSGATARGSGGGCEMCISTTCVGELGLERQAAREQLVEDARRRRRDRCGRRCGSPRPCSGAMYSGVPQTMPGLVMFVCAASAASWRGRSRRP